MPSPIGHALAGVAIAWAAEPMRRRMGGTPALAPELKLGPTAPAAMLCAALAVLPDIDLLYLPIHRTATHSLFTALLVFIVAAAVTGQVSRVRGVRGVHEVQGVHTVRWRFAAICALAYASHSICDWMGKDASVPYGLQMFWPVSDRWFISPWPIFQGTERRDIFSQRSMLINLRAAVTELVLFGSVVVAVWLRRTRRSRVPTSGQGSQPRPSA